MIVDGKDYSDLDNLISSIKECKENGDINKDDILDLVASDYRIQLQSIPNNVAQLIAYFAKRSCPNSAIDICCGTGNILYYLQNVIDDLTGVEINRNAARIASYLIPDLNLIIGDTFQYPFSRKYDFVVGNIPWGIQVESGGKRMPVEEASIRKAFTICNTNAEVILLVPYTFLVNLQFQQIRNEFSNKLKEIIELPIDALKDAPGKAALLIFGTKDISSVLLSQLNQSNNLVIEYIGSDKKEILKTNLLNRWEPEFHLLMSNDFYKKLDDLKTVPLKELAQVFNGKYIGLKDLSDTGQFIYLKPTHIQDGKLSTNKSFRYVNKKKLKESDLKYIAQPGDLLISTIFENQKIFVYKEDDFPAFVSSNLAIIRSSKQDYISTYLQTDEGKEIFGTQAKDFRRGAIIPHLSIEDLSNIQIPILPLPQLNSIGNQAIAKANSVQLEESLVLLKQYKQQIDELKQERSTNNYKQSNKILSKNNVSESFSPYAFTARNLEKQIDIHTKTLDDVSISSIKAFIDDRFQRLERQLYILNQKVDKLLDIILDLKTDFDTIKKLPRVEEEILFKLFQKIDEKLEIIYQDKNDIIEDYIQEIKRWLGPWDLLDTQSKKFLPIAEFLFDELSKIPDTDYSPFIVQYCRTLENEILKKIFEEYHSFGLRDVDINELIETDLANSTTKNFALMVKNDKRTYTMGQMDFIMSLLKKEGSTLTSSKLLKHFRKFTTSNFDEQIIEDSFLKDVDELTQKYRNKAAHPNTIGENMALECQILLRKCLNVFLDSIKVHPEPSPDSKK